MDMNQTKLNSLQSRISVLLDTASFDTDGDITTAYIPLHYSGVMDDVLEMMDIKATVGTFKEGGSFLRAYNLFTNDFKAITNVK